MSQYWSTCYLVCRTRWSAQACHYIPNFAPIYGRADDSSTWGTPPPQTPRNNPRHQWVWRWTQSPNGKEAERDIKDHEKWYNWVKNENKNISPWPVMVTYWPISFLPDYLVPIHIYYLSCVWCTPDEFNTKQNLGTLPFSISQHSKGMLPLSSFQYSEVHPRA